MVGRIVVGTLGMVNTVLSPLAPDNSLSPAGRYPLSLTGGEKVIETCVDPGKSQLKSHLNLTIDRITSKYFTARLEGLLCTSENKFQLIDLSLRLPVELLDEERIQTLPEGFGYVIHGIPNESGIGNKHFKITKLASPKGSTAVLVEWLAMEGSRPEHEPMTIWLSEQKEPTLIWKRIQMEALSRHLKNPVEVKSAVASDTASGASSGPSSGQKPSLPPR